jgi:hypothetical protein
MTNAGDGQEGEARLWAAFRSTILHINRPDAGILEVVP